MDPFKCQNAEFVDDLGIDWQPMEGLQERLPMRWVAGDRFRVAGLV